MGTVHHATGAIGFDPPVNAADLRGDRLRPFTGTDGDRSLVLERTEETVDTDEGHVTRLYANYLIPRWDSDSVTDGYYGNRHLADHLAELVEALGPDRIYSGAIEVCGDTSGIDDFDAYRLMVGTAAGRPVVYRLDARVVWNDEPTRYTPRKAVLP